MLVHVAVRTALGFAALSWPSDLPLQRNIGLLVVLAVALLWGGVDALLEDLSDEDRDELTLRWLKAAVLVGPLAGLVGWAVGGLFIDVVGAGQLPSEIIGGGAFTALLIFVPAVVGMLFGRLARPDNKSLRRGLRREPSV